MYIKKMLMIYKMKKRITTNLHDPYRLGYFMCYKGNLQKVAIMKIEANL